MVRHFYLRSLTLSEEDGHVKRIFDQRGIPLDDHPLRGSRMLGGVPKTEQDDGGYALPEPAYASDMVMEGDRLCLGFGDTRLFTEQVLGIRIVQKLSDLPAPRTLPPLSARASSLPELAELSPLEKTTGSSFDDS